MKEGIKLTGFITFKLFDSHGKLKDTRSVKNVITTAGKNALAAWLAQATQSDYFMKYLAIGTGTNAAQVSDTTLQTEIGSRAIGTISNSTNVWQTQGTFGPGVATGAITEAGIFNAASSGSMLARQVFGVINKDAGDSLQVTWQVTFS